jgi:hypothetical protein
VFLAALQLASPHCGAGADPELRATKPKWPDVEADGIRVTGCSPPRRRRPGIGRQLCHRCGRWIDRGDQVRFLKGFIGVVHSECRPPEVTAKALAAPAVTGKREPNTTPCSECHLIHAGQCW